MTRSSLYVEVNYRLPGRISFGRSERDRKRDGRHPSEETSGPNKATRIGSCRLPARRSGTGLGVKAALLICLTIVHALPLASMAGTQTIEAARTAFADGRFVEAAELAEALETSEGYALAAESLAIHGYYIAEDDEKQAFFDRAAQLAREAIRLDAVNPQGHLQLAHAMGRYAQTVGVLKAVKEGYAAQVRDAIKKALRLDPEMPSAHLSLATWHTEAVNAGGFMAGLLYGASKKDALAHYEKALELAPDSKTVPFEYALGLLLLSSDRNRDRARGSCARLARARNRNGVEGCLRPHNSPTGGQAVGGSRRPVAVAGATPTPASRAANETPPSHMS